MHRDAFERAGLLGMAEVEGRAVVALRSRCADLDGLGRWEEVADEDWAAAWRAGLDAIRVGPLTITPPWLDHAAADIVIDPGQAFGTGHHETTIGCLTGLTGLAIAGRSVLDVGTGTGVLAIAAHRLGAARVVAVDTDPVAVGVARANVAVNDADVVVRRGSADAVEGVFDVVVANLETTTISSVAPHLVARLAPSGTLLASGVSLERADEAAAALTAAGVRVQRREGTEWLVFEGRRPG